MVSQIRHNDFVTVNRAVSHGKNVLAFLLVPGQPEYSRLLENLFVAPKLEFELELDRSTNILHEKVVSNVLGKNVCALYSLTLVNRINRNL